jgi:hypothetical protein
VWDQLMHAKDGNLWFVPFSLRGSLGQSAMVAAGNEVLSA